MRILFIANYGDLYGANRSLLSIIRYFKVQGSTIVVLLPKRGGMSLALEQLGVKIKVIPYFSSFLFVKFKLKYLIWPFLLVYNLFISIYLLVVVWQFRPSLIYSNTLAENIGIFVAKILKYKHLLHVREFMSLDHGGFFVFGEMIKRRFLGLSDAIIFVSKSVKAYHLPNGGKEGMSKVIYNGVTAPVYENVDKDFRGKSFRFGIVGIIDPGKGHLKAFEYFEMLNNSVENVELHVFGDKSGSYKDILKSFVEKKNLQDKIFFHGFVESIDEIYKSIDTLLMFSVSEGFGRVSIEAMARGIPVIGFNNGGTSEIVDNFKDGYLFENYEEFFLAFEHLRANYHEISFSAYQKYQLNFSEDVYVERVFSFVNEVLKK